MGVIEFFVNNSDLDSKFSIQKRREWSWDVRKGLKLEPNLEYCLSRGVLPGNNNVLVVKRLREGPICCPIGIPGVFWSDILRNS
jgi:hypothetical protein